MFCKIIFNSESNNFIVKSKLCSRILIIIFSYTISLRVICVCVDLIGIVVHSKNQKLINIYKWYVCDRLGNFSINYIELYNINLLITERWWVTSLTILSNSNLFP